MNQRTSQVGTELLQQLIVDYEGPLVRYARRLLDNDEQARDVAQETLIKLCEQPPGKLKSDTIRAWMFTVCRNRAVDVCRKESRMISLNQGQVGQCVSQEKNQAVAAELADDVRHILSILETLSENQREVIRLKLQEGLSYKEISQVTGLTISNVGFLIHKGIKTIRECLAVQALTPSEESIRGRVKHESKQQ